MSPNLPSLKELETFLRIDLVEGDEESELISFLIKIAVEDLKESGITIQTSNRYKLAVMLLVANHYEERKPEVIGTVTKKLSYSLDRIILQLKAAELKLDSEIVGETNESS